MTRPAANDRDSVAPMQRLGSAFLAQMDRQDRIRFMAERPDEALAALRIAREADATYALTPRQADTLDFVRAYLARTGASPTYQQIADGIGLASKQGIHRLVVALEERGHIRRIPGRRQSIVVVEGRG